MYIIRVCKWYGYSKDQIHRLFESVIMSLFKCGIEVWAASSDKATHSEIWLLFQLHYTDKCNPL